MLSVNNLNKVYDDGHVALRDVSFDASANQVLGLIGPNGAGKSTLLNIVNGLVLATEGTVTIDGRSPQAFAATGRLGFVRDAPGFPSEESSAQKALELAYRWHGAQDPPSITLPFDCDGPEWKKPIRSYSRGMRRQLAINMAWIARPTLLILDEASTDLDPTAQERLFQTIRESRDGGVCVLYSSHHLEEVEAIADRVLMVRKGRASEIEVRDLRSTYRALAEP